jgi:hypothetical protein
MRAGVSASRRRDTTSLGVDHTQFGSVAASRQILAGLLLRLTIRAA